MLKYLLVALVSVGCGSYVHEVINVVAPPRFITEVDPEVADDYYAFLERCSRSKYAKLCAENRTKISSVRVVDVVRINGLEDVNVIGRCNITAQGRLIELERNWISRGGFDKRQLIKHESFHCLAQTYGQPVHKEGYHIMAPRAIVISTQEEWDRLEDELFR